MPTQSSRTFLETSASLLGAHADPTAAFAVVLGPSEDIRSQSFGVTHPASKQPVTGKAWFRIGSITKTLVAFAVLHLAERQHLDIEEGIEKDLSDALGFQVDWKITPASLLSHTARLRNYVPIAFPSPMVTSIRSHLADRAPPLFSYSNVGYALIGEWMNYRTGGSFEEWLIEHALEPLSTPDGVRLLPPATSDVVIGQVMNPVTESRETIRLDFPDFRFAPAGYLWATGDGFAQVLSSLALPPSGEARSIFAKMATPRTPVFGPQRLACGLGLFTTSIGNRPMVLNEGEIGGFRARIEIDPDQGTARGAMTGYSGPGAPLPLLFGQRGGELGGDSGMETAESPAIDSEEKTFVSASVGVLRCQPALERLSGSLNGLSFNLRSRGPHIWVGDCGDRTMLVHASHGLSSPAIHVNGNLMVASRLRPRSAVFDSRWLGKYLNGYWIEISRSSEADPEVASNYNGERCSALPLGSRTLATNMGIMVFSGCRGRRRLHLLGTATFPEE